MALLSARGLGKSYGVPVLDDVDLDLHAGSVHALVGANGAGKSTLTRILCGLVRADTGTMTLDARPYAPSTRHDAEAAGVQLVLQELTPIETLSVAENLFLADLPRRFGFVDARTLHARAERALARVGLAAIGPRTPMARLGIGQRQLVEVAAALARPCRVLVLDEPTAALTARETDTLLVQVRRLRASGLAILYISHRLGEVAHIADRITVLRDGRVVATHDPADVDSASLVESMTGIPATTSPHRSPSIADPTAIPALRVEGLTRGNRVRGVGFDVARGEILGIFGLVGAGRTETLRALVGADAPDAGRVLRGGIEVRIRSPRDAARAGIGMVPEDRQSQALLPGLSVRANTGLAALPSMAYAGTWVDTARERERVGGLVDALEVRCRSIEQPVGELSGGNQQKVILGRWLLRDVEVLLLDEPTRGVDMGAKAAIHRVFGALAARGRSLVVASSELEELTAISDRILVLSAGRVAACVPRGEWTDAGLMAAAFSGHEDASASVGVDREARPS